jgi:hypothetical protein
MREDDLDDVVPRDSEIYSAMRRASSENGGAVEAYIEAANSLANAMPLALSIDNYLEAHQEDDPKITVGKLAIAKAILGAEAASSLAYSDNWEEIIDFDKVSETWFVRFMQAATEGATTADLDYIFEDISIINFNYDRCIEHFVKHALQVYYDLTEERAVEVANRLYVFHPYGSVGLLPWQQGGTGVLFGSRKRGDALLRIARSIKTFSERIDEGTELHEMRVRVANAEQIIFLGFAYHRQNLQLLSPGYPAQPKSLYGTALGISKSDQTVLRQQIPGYMSPASEDITVNLTSLTSAQIIGDYWRTFTAA